MGEPGRRWRTALLPRGITTDAAGNVYVADTDNDRIQKFTSDGTFITKWGSEGTGNGQFYYPSDVATDAAGNVYVVERGARIQKFTSDGAFIAKWGSSGSTDGHFVGPEGIATDAIGNVYVADTLNQRIQKFTSDGDFLTKWGGDGNANGQFVDPKGIATDAAGNVYVADAEINNRIQKFTSDGRFITQWGRGPSSTTGRKRKPLTIPTTRRKATFRAACRLSNRCSAQVIVKAGKKTLARGRYSIPAHSSHRVAISLTKAGRKALSRKRGVRAKLTIVDPRTRKHETLRVVLRGR